MPYKTSGTVFVNRKLLHKASPKASQAFVSPKFDDLDQMIRRASSVIFETEAVFPFDTFPNKITICADKVILTYRDFFSKDEFPLLIENIVAARVTRSFIFASLTIETFGLKEAPRPIGYLKSTDARLARRYILALLECKKANIDLSKYDIASLQDKLKTIGAVRESGKLPQNI